MANIRKLSAFRQLSLNCESPTVEQRRKSLKKQFSEDLPNVKCRFSETVTSAGKTRDRPPKPILAWADEEIQHHEDAGVIVKKCTKELKPTPNNVAKLTRHSSLEKDSILYSKQELADRLRVALKQREQEKPNLNIFLAQNSIEDSNNDGAEFYEQFQPDSSEAVQKVPKLMPPLLNTEQSSKNLFHIRKHRPDNTSVTATTISCKSSAVVVIPLTEKDENGSQLRQAPRILPPQILTPSPRSPRGSKSDIKAINHVIIRPSTAASKRDSFKKRTNSAFNSISKEDKPPSRPSLVRSSSAPSRAHSQDQTANAKPKFLATKRKIKSGKRKEAKLTYVPEDEDGSNKENPKSKRELNRYVAVHGTDIVTMVSLTSPAASDGEDVAETDKNQQKNGGDGIGSKGRNGSPIKSNGIIKKQEERDGVRNLSLRKTVKSVSFQQSSIHAIRSFSASFPARRSSMITAAFAVAGTMKGAYNGTTQNHKNHEKRTTNSTISADDVGDERGPKRRLLRSATMDGEKSSGSPDTLNEPTKDHNQTDLDPSIKVDIKSKNIPTESARTESSTPLVIEDQTIPEDNDINNKSEEAGGINEGDGSTAQEQNKDPEFNSPKEKQCWEMYCKMTQRGINVSYDTILRGMLTPTEYRMRKKDLPANTSSEEEHTDPNDH